MYRIHNDTQRAETAAMIEGFKKQFARITKDKGQVIGERIEKGYSGLVKQFHEQIRRYDELKAGLPPFEGKDLHDLGSYLIDARIAAGVTQEELAKKIGVSQPMIYKYEMNEYHGYSLETIEKVAEALNIEIDLHASLKK